MADLINEKIKIKTHSVRFYSLYKTNIYIWFHFRKKEKNRKCSPEEIQRKRQAALVRRMAKAQASFVRKAAPLT